MSQLRFKQWFLWVVFFTVLALTFAVTAVMKHDDTIKGKFWLDNATSQIVRPSSFEVKRETNMDKARRWGAQEAQDIDAGRNDHTNGKHSAQTLNQDPDFKQWAKGQYRDWLNRAAKSPKFKRCCNWPDPDDWYNGLIDKMRNGACHMTATRLEDVKCAAEITDQIVLHPSAVLLGDAADCAARVGVGGVITSSFTIRWNKLIGHVGGLPVYAPRWTWFLNSPGKVGIATTACLGTKYIFGIINGN